MDLGHRHTGPDPDRQSGRPMVGIDIVALATIFTLIVLLTGGPGNRL